MATVINIIKAVFKKITKLDESVLEIDQTKRKKHLLWNVALTVEVLMEGSL